MRFTTEQVLRDIIGEVNPEEVSDSGLQRIYEEIVKDRGEFSIHAIVLWFIMKQRGLIKWEPPVKKERRCSICREVGHNRATCQAEWINFPKMGGAS